MVDKTKKRTDKQVHVWYKCKVSCWPNAAGFTWREPRESWGDSRGQHQLVTHIIQQEKGQSERERDHSLMVICALQVSTQMSQHQVGSENSGGIYQVKLFVGHTKMWIVCRGQVILELLWYTEVFLSCSTPTFNSLSMCTGWWAHRFFCHPCISSNILVSFRRDLSCFSASTLLKAMARDSMLGWSLCPAYVSEYNISRKLWAKFFHSGKDVHLVSRMNWWKRSSLLWPHVHPFLWGRYSRNDLHAEYRMNGFDFDGQSSSSLRYSLHPILISAIWHKRHKLAKA